MKAFLLPFSLVALALLNQGCASDATVDGMVAHSQVSADQVPAFLRHNVQVLSTSGGQTTDAMATSKVPDQNLKQALRLSLQGAGMDAADDSSKYVLKASLAALDQPMFGFDMTVHSRIYYSLIDRKSQTVVYRQEIAQDYTAGFSDSFVGTTRLRYANEGAIRRNIEEFIRTLVAWNPSKTNPK